MIAEASAATSFLRMFNFRSLPLLLLLPLLAACAQAERPGAQGQNLAGGGAGVGNGGGATTSVVAYISGGGNLLARFPSLARLQLTVTGPAGTPGLPVRMNLPIDGSPAPVSLPLGVPLAIAFDCFDAAAAPLYLANGNSIVTLQAGQSPLIPVNILAVAPGTVYVDPLLVVAPPPSILTVIVVDGASRQPLAGAVVALGAGGTPMGLTDAAGSITFNATGAQDLHVFAGNRAVSVLGFAGTALVVPMPDPARPLATVSINGALGPTLSPAQLLDIYFTDGMSVAALGGVAGDLSALRTLAVPSMHGPIGVTLMVEDPLQITPKPDLGLRTYAIAADHYSAAPLLLAAADPYTAARQTTLGYSISIPATPTGMNPIVLTQQQVFGVQPNGEYLLLSHDDKALLPSNRRDFTVWPLATTSRFIGHTMVTDGYGAASERWESVLPPLAGASFAAAPTMTGVPTISAAAGGAVSWTDPAGALFSQGWTLEMQQGNRIWQVHSLGTAPSFLFPLQPAPVLSSAGVAARFFDAGVAASAVVRRYQFDPAAGFNPAIPDLWYLPRMLLARGSSAPVAFMP